MAKIEVLPQFYLDSAVVAYRIPDGDETQAQLNPQVTASGGSANVPALSDGDVNTVALDLPAAAPGGQSWVLFDYGHPQTIQAITLATADATASVWDDGNTGILPVLEASDDGQTFGKIADIPRSSVVERTVSFTAVTARYFGLCFRARNARKPQSAYYRAGTCQWRAGGRIRKARGLCNHNGLLCDLRSECCS